MSPDIGIDAAGRNRAALETFARHEEALRRTALRYSLCSDDADEALARGFEILIRKAPSEELRALVRWTHTVVKHEALAVRAERERVLSGPAASPLPSGEDWTAMIPSGAAGPAEQAERRDAVARTREALQTLKPAELRALTLLAAGYSYREIGTITGYSATKVNRSLSEGRERFRRFLARAAAGGRCTELAPLISSYADGEAGTAEAASVHEHLRACAHCRATLRAYRAAPRAAAALAPTLPLHRPLLERAHDAAAGLVSRFGGGGGDSGLTGLAASGGTRGAGMTALAKVLAVCAGTVGGAAACFAGGVVPAPLAPAEPHHVRAAPAHHHQRVQLVDDVEPGGSRAPAYEPEAPLPVSEAPAPDPTPEPARHEHHEEPKQDHEPAPAPVEEAAPEPPPTEAGAVEYAPPPEETVVEAPAVPTTSSAASTPAASSSSPAGEFGP